MPRLKRQPKVRPKVRLSARNADKYILYSESVQDTEVELEFIQRVYRRLARRELKSIREDFCATAHLAVDWVRSGPGRTAVGVDIDDEPLRWSRRHRLSHLSAEQRRRLVLVRDDVRTAKTSRVDAVLALNFSYCVFMERATMLDYVKHCFRELVPGGILVFDAYGGPEAQRPQKDRTRYRGFTYVWDQAEYNPINHEAINYIHFLFPDGTAMRRAFRYHWRLWTLRELTEIFVDAGFASPIVYWEDADKEGEGNGVFRPRKVAPVEDAWIAYIVAQKPR